MFTFLLSLVLLLAGYFTYGALVERIFKPDPARTTPALANNDGVDYVPLDWKKIFLIQLLNIAGLGPIFGAISGALWGPVAFLWIVFGCIFAGAVHDYFSGMLSVRNNGASVSEITGTVPGFDDEKCDAGLLRDPSSLSWNGVYDWSCPIIGQPYSRVFNDEFLAGCGAGLLLFRDHFADR